MLSLNGLKDPTAEAPSVLEEMQSVLQPKQMVLWGRWRMSGRSLGKQEGVLFHLLLAYFYIFSTSESDLGWVRAIHHEITITGTLPS